MTRYGLSVDWDYFMGRCPEGVDYTHNCTHGKWASRPPQSFRDNLFELIKRHMLRRVDSGLICENHARAYRWFKDCDVVLNLDYHLDNANNYFHHELVSCRCWVPALEVDYGTRVIQCFPPPSGKEEIPFIVDPHLVDGVVRDFDRALICRSSPWTDPRHDREFLDRTQGLGFHMEEGLHPRDLGEVSNKTPGRTLAEQQFLREREMSVRLSDGPVIVF